MELRTTNGEIPVPVLENKLVKLASTTEIRQQPASAPAKYTGSLEKKRARDRRAQHNLRTKRQSQLQSLQNQVLALQQELEDVNGTCQALRQENEILHRRQDMLQRALASWYAEGPLSLPISIPGAHRRPVPEQDDPTSIASSEKPGFSHDTPDAGQSVDPGCLASLVQAPDFSTLPMACPAEMENELSETIEEYLVDSFYSTSLDNISCITVEIWGLTPAHLTDDLVVTDIFKGWLTRPDLVRACPDDPQPLELLFGSPANFLTNLISRALQPWLLTDAMRLAGGWLLYHFIKWTMDPSETSFSRLQDFQKPVLEQLAEPHAHFVDWVPWPRLRVNLMKCQQLYDPADMVSLFGRCIKLRWPRHEPFLEQNQNGQWRMRPDFLEFITKLDGWLITDDFVSRYPMLAKGLDPEAVSSY